MKNATNKILMILFETLFVLLISANFSLAQREIAAVSTGEEGIYNFEILHDEVALDSPLNIRCNFEPNPNSVIEEKTGILANHISEIWWWGLDCEGKRIGRPQLHKF